MIKIVYRNLSPGLHASAEAEGRNTVISFLPGLTPEQRRAALRRIRHSGRMGHGPRVPGGRLAIALALDRVRAAARTCTAVVRLHPAGSTLPVAFFSAAAVIFVLMATVSIHVLPAPRSSGQEPGIGGVTPVPGLSAPAGGQSGAPSGRTGAEGRAAARHRGGWPRGSSRRPARPRPGSRGVPSGTQGSGSGAAGPGSDQAPRDRAARPGLPARPDPRGPGAVPVRAVPAPAPAPVRAVPAPAVRARAVPVRAVPVRARPVLRPAPGPGPVRVRVRVRVAQGPAPVGAVPGPAAGPASTSSASSRRAWACNRLSAD